MGKKPRSPPAPPAAPFHDAFSKLRERLPPDHVPAPPEPPQGPPPPARAVVRLERKGRSGKEVTAVEKLGLSPGVLAAWADDLKRALGCGGGVEGDAIILQGDQRDRARTWLERRGVRKVAMG